MALNQQLEKFNKQQEKCQSTLLSIASSRARLTSSRPAAKISHKQPPLKFSQDTKRLQEKINIRNSSAAAQIKIVIDLLFKTRRAYTAEQIKEECYVDMHANNNAVFNSLTNNNPKVHYDGRRFSYKPTHDVSDRSQLRSLVFKYPDGIDVADLKDSYPSVMEDLQALKASGHIFWLISGAISKDGIVYPDGFQCPIQVDDDFRALYHSIKVPSDFLDVEKELRKHGLKPATDTAARRAAAQMHGISINEPKHKKKKKQEISKRTKLTNVHLPELFQSLNASTSRK